MEKMGLIERKVLPVRIEYYPTKKGERIALQPIIEMITKPILGNIIVKTFLKTKNQENLKYSKVKKLQVFEVTMT